MVLALRPGVWDSNPIQTIYSGHVFIHLFLNLLDFVSKMGARPGLTKEPLIPFNVQKVDLLPDRLSIINK